MRGPVRIRPSPLGEMTDRRRKVNRKDAGRVLRRLDRVPGLRVTGMRAVECGGWAGYRRGPTYGVEAVCLATGYPLVIWDIAQAIEIENAVRAERVEE